MPSRSAEREQFLKDILITAIESGYEGVGYWAVHRDYDHEAGTVTLLDREDDNFGEEDGQDHYDITIETIATGLRRLLDGSIPFFPSGYSGLDQLRLADRTNGEDGDYDADVADAIVQAGIFGKLVFG